MRHCSLIDPDGEVEVGYHGFTTHLDSEASIKLFWDDGTKKMVEIVKAHFAILEFWQDEDPKQEPLFNIIPLQEGPKVVQ